MGNTEEVVLQCMFAAPSYLAYGFGFALLLNVGRSTIEIKKHVAV